MSYGNSTGDYNNMEFANKEGFISILENPFVKNILNNLDYKDETLLDTEKQKDILSQVSKKISLKDVESNIKTIFAVDGGYNLVNLGKNTRVAYFKIGLNTLDLKKLEDLNKKRFISPSDINSINSSKVITFPFPIDNLKTKNKEEITEYILKKVFREYNLFETLYWIFNLKEIKENVEEKFSEEMIVKELLRFFDLNTVTSDRINTNLGTITSIIEQTLLLSKLKEIYNNDIHNISNYLFIRDGTLSFSTKGSVFREKVEYLFEYLQETNSIFFISLEKSGVLQEYISFNEESLPSESIIPIDNFFIKEELKWPSYFEGYYGGKVISTINKKNYIINTINSFKDKSVIKDKTKKEIIIILKTLELIQSFYYDNSILSIIFINQDVSISSDSSELLKKYTLDNILT